MFGILLFVVAQLLATGYACWRGGAPERLAGVLLFAAMIAGSVTPLLTVYTYAHLNWPLFRIDLVLLFGLVAVALLADRFWPMWLAAFQLLAIGTHGVRVYSPDVVPIAYWAISSRIAYPMLLVLVVGTWRHRVRLLAGFPEYGWTRQRLRQDERGTAQTADRLVRR